MAESEQRYDFKILREDREDGKEQWYWNLESRGEVLCTGLGYNTDRSALHTVLQVMRKASAATVSVDGEMKELSFKDV